MPLLQVTCVVHVGIRLALKTNVAVSITVKKQSDEPFRHIPNVEAHNEHLPHLTGVDEFMPKQRRSKSDTVPAKQHPEEVHGMKTLQRQHIVAYYYHKHKTAKHTQILHK